VTPDWIALSQNRGFYCWTQGEIDRAQTVMDVAQENLDALNLDSNATPAQIDAAIAGHSARCRESVGSLSSSQRCAKWLKPHFSTQSSRRPHVQQLGLRRPSSTLPSLRASGMQ